MPGGPNRCLLTGDSPTSLAVADFNGDGVPDLAVLKPSTSVDGLKVPIIDRRPVHRRLEGKRPYSYCNPEECVSFRPAPPDRRCGARGAPGRGP
jgi:hypothetical protein